MATNRLTRCQFVVALTLPALLQTSGVGAQTGRTTLSLATAGPGSAFLGFARAVAPVVAKRVPVDLDIRQTNGSNENAELVNSGQVPIATLNLGPGYDAWNGRGQFAGRTLRDIRAVIPMYETPFATIALKGEGIGALRDLGHKRVGVGPAQGPGEVFFRGLADGLGLKPTVVTGSPTDLVQKLLAREIDAFGTALDCQARRSWRSPPRRTPSFLASSPTRSKPCAAFFPTSHPLRFPPTSTSGNHAPLRPSPCGTSSWLMWGRLSLSSTN
jgi:TRAP transporter TAXI family solute receptor